MDRYARLLATPAEDWSYLDTEYMRVEMGYFRNYMGEVVHKGLEKQGEDLMHTYTWMGQLICIMRAERWRKRGHRNCQIPTSTTCSSVFGSGVRVWWGAPHDRFLEGGGSSRYAGTKLQLIGIKFNIG